MNLLPTAEQREIVDSLSDFLGARAPVSRLRPPARRRAIPIIGCSATWGTSEFGAAVYRKRPAASACLPPRRA
jgi:hypothetical protein